MIMNANLDLLQPYPFAKMAKLLENSRANPDFSPIKLSIGEPKHAPASFILEALKNHLDKVQNYPATQGLPELRQAMADWAVKRFALADLNPQTQILPVMGTREALFSFVQAVIRANPSANLADRPYVVMPNPFYQIYEGACLLAQAQPYFVSCTADNNFVGDYRSVPDSVWQKTQLVFVCSPNNPTGAVMPFEDWQYLIEKADEFDFILASDECYSELYFGDDAPIGLLQVCAQLGRHDFRRCVVFHSLSKRSNLPGLRSGFVAGDAQILQAYLQYRTYQGCAMPLHHQYASIVAWQDEDHVRQNRALYQQKFDLWLTELGDTLNLRKPEAGFYFWLAVPQKFDQDDEKFVKALYEDLNIHALAGSYLGRKIDGKNAGSGFVRLALVADLNENAQAIDRLKNWL